MAGTTQNLTRNRGLIRFDLASIIPADATIISATLDVDAIYQSVVGQENSLFGLYRMLKPWNEGNNVATDNAGGRGAPALAGDATWASQIFPTVPWNAPGGTAGIDYAGSFSSSAFISGVGTYNFESTLDTVADAQQWLTHPEANYGWMLVCQSEDLAFTARRFASSEDGTGGPLLTLEYTLVPEPFTLALFPLLLVGFLLTRHP